MNRPVGAGPGGTDGKGMFKDTEVGKQVAGAPLILAPLPVSK